MNLKQYISTIGEEGTGNSYTTLFRQYDPRLGRWLSVDPLADKFPSVNSYVGMGNNPVMFVDMAGDSAVKIVDNANKTITIKATYVVDNVNQGSYTQTDNKGNNLDIQSWYKDVNDELNNQNYPVTKGKYKGYSVKFDLEFVPMVDNDGNWNFPNNYTYDGYAIGNSITKGDKNSPYLVSRVKNDFKPFVKNGNTASRGGMAYERTDIVIHKNYDHKLVRVHEIFHTFDFSRDGASSGTGSYQSLPNQDDINIMINNPNLPEVFK